MTTAILDGAQETPDLCLANDLGFSRGRRGGLAILATTKSLPAREEDREERDDRACHHGDGRRDEHSCACATPEDGCVDRRCACSLPKRRQHLLCGLPPRIRLRFQRLRDERRELRG